MLAELCRRFRFQPVTTGDFQALAREFLPRGSSAEDFFESWVYDTGIPALKLNWSVRGSAPARLTGTVAQGGVEDGFSCEVPVAIYFAKGAPLIHWVKTSADLTYFSVTLNQPPTRVVLLTSDFLAMPSSR
jgi:aminopeptidase N